MSSEKGCPFHHVAGGGTSNRDFWPNQLRLDLFRHCLHLDLTFHHAHTG